MIELIKKRYKSIAMALSLLVALFGQWLLLRNQFFFALVLFIFAVAVFVTIVGEPKISSYSTPLQLQQMSYKRNRNYYILFGASLGLAIVSFFLFEGLRNSLFPWVIHIISIIVFLVSVAAISIKNQARPNLVPQAGISERNLLIIIMLLGAIIRFVKLDGQPFGLWFDEADFGLKAMQTLSDKSSFPVFFADIRVPAYFIYLMTLSFKIFGISIPTLRFVSAFFGVVTIAAAYFCGSELFNRKTGLLLAFLIAFSRWHLNWSRIGLDNITVPFFELLVIALLMRAFRRLRLMDFALAGLGLGLGLSFYASMRLFPVVIGLWFLAKWIRDRHVMRSTWPGLVVFSLAVVVSVIPIAQYALYNPQAFWSRINEASIFKGRTLQESWSPIVENTQEHLLMFNYKGDYNGRHNLPGQPMLDPISASLMVVGFGIALTRYKEPKYLLVVLWFLIMLLPGILSLDFESPQSLRAIGSLPAAYLLAVIPIYEIWKITETEYIKPIINGISIFLGIIFVFSAIYNLSLYFTYQSKSSDSWTQFSTRETIIGKKMAQVGDEASYYLSTFYHNTPTVRFLAPKITQTTKLETYDVFPLDNGDSERSIFFIDPEREPFFDLARKYFPNADFTKIKDPDGTTILFEMDIQAADYFAVQGLSASYYADLNFTGYPFYVDQQRHFQFQWDENNRGQYPFGVQMDGTIYIPDFGEYRFEIQSTEESKMFIDGQSVEVAGNISDNSSVKLAKGNHKIRIQTVANAGKFALFWQPMEGERQPLNSNNLFVPPVSANGLLGKYYASPDWSGEVAYAQIDPFINFYYHNQPLPRPYTVEWEGQIDIPTDGEYVFGLQSIDESRLFIDDALLIDDDIRDANVDVSLNLNAGKHAIRIQYADRTGYTYIKLFWTKPDGTTEIIPQEVLSLP